MAKKGSPSKKSGFPTWIRPAVSMIVGGSLGLVVSGMLPDAIAPYAAPFGVLVSKFVGGGSWGKYAMTAGVVGALTFMSKRQSIQVAAGGLRAAKQSLIARTASGGGSGSAADKANAIVSTLRPR